MTHLTEYAENAQVRAELNRLLTDNERLRRELHQAQTLATRYQHELQQARQRIASLQWDQECQP